ncbi:MAG: hypothetical protein ABSF47_00025 [Minisyncoccia bacterium]|jgi:hypothetical protein
MAIKEGTLADIVEDTGTAFFGDSLYHLLFGGGDIGKKIGGFFGNLSKNDPRSEFVSLVIKLDPTEREIFRQIYHWWFAPKPKGADRKEDTFVTLVMKVKLSDRGEFISLITRKWAHGEKDEVKDLFYQLEHDVLDQYIQKDLVEPILQPLANSLEKVKARFQQRREARRNR